MRVLFLFILLVLLQTICVGQTVEDLDIQNFTGLHAPSLRLEDHLSLSFSRYTYKYDGLQGVLVSRGNSQFRKYQNKHLQDLWSARNRNICDWARFLQECEFKSLDFQYGRWWERSVFDSMLPEKGGISTREIIVGSELPVITWKEISLMNTGRLKFGKWGVDLTDIRVPTPQELLNDPTTVFRQRDPPFSFRAITPRGNLDTGTFKVTTFQNITLRASLKPEKILTRIEVGVNVKFLTYQNKPWGSLTVRGRAAPFEHYYEASINFELLCFQ